MGPEEKFKAIYSKYNSKIPLNPEEVDRNFELATSIGLPPHIAGGVAIAVSTRNYSDPGSSDASERAQKELGNASNYLAENYRKLCDIIEPTREKAFVNMGKLRSALRDTFRAEMISGYNDVLRMEKEG